MPQRKLVDLAVLTQMNLKTNGSPSSERSEPFSIARELVQLYLNWKRKCDIVREYDLSPSLLDKWIKQSTSTVSFKETDNRTDKENELI